MDKSNGSRGHKLVMLALNKKTKQEFSKKRLSNKYKRARHSDEEYVPSNLDSSSEGSYCPQNYCSDISDIDETVQSNISTRDSVLPYAVTKGKSNINISKIISFSKEPITQGTLTGEGSSSQVEKTCDSNNIDDQIHVTRSHVLPNILETDKSLLQGESEPTENIQITIPDEVNENDVADSDNGQNINSRTNNSSDESNIQYTKKGTVRKRQKYEISVSERKKRKYDTFVEKHGVKNGCGEQCPKKCTQNISEARREFLNSEFWKMTDEKERKSFILHHISSTAVKQRTTVVATDVGQESYRRNNSYNYMLKNENGTSHSVCKIFFLTTLGFNGNNDKVVRTALLNAKNSVVPVADMRCTKEPHNKIDDEVIRQHISTFNPTISHYRREHAPRRLYLPSDLSFTAMHEDFLNKNPNFKCSYEKYRVVAKKMNVSLANLGHEECESCEVFNLHNKSHTKNNLDENCDVCMTWSKHIERANKSRAKYREDAIRDEEVGEIVYCADLEKVIMLPRLEMFKSAIFTNRLTVYNESFVPVGKKRNSKPFAALWHEAMFKRNKEELISTFYQFFISKRDVLKITLWLDNCTAQNKNWALFSFLIYIVNSDEICANEINMKYFVPGHTFMAADSFHHRVEVSMKKMGNKLYDFSDFVQAVKGAAHKTEVLPMELQHFYIWEDFSSQYKLTRIEPRPYLHDMVQVTVHRGSYNITYKNDFDGPSFDLNFLTAKITKNGKLRPPKKQTKVLGISSQKKANIIKNLSGIMKNRLQFWDTLPVSDEN